MAKKQPRRRYIPLPEADKIRELLVDAQDQRQAWIRQLNESRAGYDHPRKIRLRSRIANIEADIRDLRQRLLEAQRLGVSGNAN